MADVLRVRPAVVLKRFWTALGLVALWKAVDLALRLPDAAGHSTSILLVGTWIAGAALLVLRRPLFGGAALAITGLGSIHLGGLYNHHLYLLIVIGLIVGLFEPSSQVTLLRAQLTIVYVFAALTKINGTYLSGAVVEAAADRSSAFGSAALSSDLVLALSIGAIVIELLLPLALWWPATRRAAAAVGVAFHVGVVVGTAHDLESFVQLTTYGATMLALYLVFFEGSRRQGHSVVGSG